MIKWDFIKFEKGEFCINGITLESETEFHIWDDSEILFGKEGDLSNYNNISVTFSEIQEITTLAKMYLEGSNEFLKGDTNEE